jgi:hypothetical protein
MDEKLYEERYVGTWWNDRQQYTITTSKKTGRAKALPVVMLTCR